MEQTAAHKPMSSTAKAVWSLLGGLAVLAGGITVGVLVSKPKKSSGGGTLPTSAVWTKLVPDSTGKVGLPANATFALSLPSSDPAASTIGEALAALQTAGNISSVQGYGVNQALPPGYPDDGLGTQAYRATGVVGATAFMLPVNQSMQVWIVTGTK
jgi:hypothetical protein